jgi:hypothetical protein
MNKAQQRTWYRLAVSVAGLAVMSAVLAIIEINVLEIADATSHTALRGLGLLCTIPLILVVIVDRGWKRIYDERDMYIERQSLIVGAIAAFVFLGGAALVLLAAKPRGSIDVFHLASLIYLAYFTWLTVSSTVALTQYGREVKDEQ